MTDPVCRILPHQTRLTRAFWAGTAIAHVPADQEVNDALE